MFRKLWRRLTFKRCQDITNYVECEAEATHRVEHNTLFAGTVHKYYCDKHIVSNYPRYVLDKVSDEEVR